MFDLLRVKESLVKSKVAKCITSAALFKFTNLCNQGFPGGAVVKNPPANAGDIRNVGFTPGLRRSAGGEHGNPLQYSWFENSMDRGVWWATVHGIAKSWTRLSTHTYTHTHSRDNSALNSILLIKYKLLLELILILRLIANY